MHVMVTGAAGFIGYHVSQHLLAGGHQVTGLDNLNDYYNPALKRRRLSLLQAQPGFQFKEIMLHDSEAVKESFKDESLTHCLNLAAQAGVRYSLTNPNAYVDSNLRGFVNIMEGVRHHQNIKRLVYASSSSVYGGNTKLPFSESDPVDRPISLYAATKRSNELMAHTYTHLYGMETVGLRFFTVYGPFGRPDMMMWIFARAIREGKALPVFGQGDMYRDFTYIDDIVQGVVKSLFVEGLDPFEVFNIGNHQSEHLEKVISLMEEYLGTKANKNYMDMQPGDVRKTYADIDLIKRKLGFEPTTTVETGLKNFLEWYQAEGQQYDL